MQALTDKSSAARLGLLCLLLGMVAVLPCRAEEPAAGDGAAQAAAAQEEDPAKPAAPKKIAYDKLPLAQLVQRTKADDLKAQFELGARLNYGRGMPKNTKEALRWLRRAAQNGQQDAQRLLALKFYHGYDVSPDQVEALKWTQRLAEAGDVPAQLTLANMYASGEGTERNLVRAYMWYDIASAAAGIEGSPEEVEKAAQSAAEQRDKVADLLLPEQEVEAQQLSGDWWLQKHGVSLEQKKPANSSRQSAKARQRK